MAIKTAAQVRLDADPLLPRERALARDIIDSIPSIAGLAPTILSAKNRGAIGDGVANDSVALNSAAQHIKRLGGGTLIIPRGSYYIGADTFYIPAVVSIVKEPGAVILYDGLGVGMHVDAESTADPHRFGRWDVRIKRPDVEWDDGADTSSVGVRFTNIRQAQINVYQVENFYKGLQPYGDTTGSVDIIFHLGLIRNNRYGLSPDRVNSGWANQNTYIGGAIRLDSAYDGVEGFPAELLDLTLGNGNTFIGVNLEGSIELPSKTAHVVGSYNTFIGCRLEGQGAGTFHFDTGSIGNQVIGGYDNFGPEGDVFDDDGTSNRISGGRGASFYGDEGAFGGVAVLARALSGAGAIMFQARDTDDEVHWEVTGGGEVRLYAGDGKGVIAHPSITLVPSTGSINMGGGTAAPQAILKAASESVVDFQNKYFRTDTTGRRGVRWTTLADGATAISLAAGAGFLTANTGATVLATLTGGIDGQEFFVKAGDANTTISDGDCFKTKDGNDLVLASGRVVKFMAVSATVAWEL